MKKRFLLILAVSRPLVITLSLTVCVLVLISSGRAIAQTPPKIEPVTASDIQSPPIPIVKGIVEGVVGEQRALILTPDQAEAIKRTISGARMQEQFQYPNKFIAKPVVRSMVFEQDSSKQPRMLRLFMGTVTALVFSDLNGNPWLVSRVTLDCNQFDDGTSCRTNGGGGQSGTPAPTNIVKVWPTKPYAYGNIMVELEGYASPITLMMSTGQSDENDIRIDARVAGKNPNAPPQPIQLSRMPDHDGMMGYFLDGVAPQGATRLKVSGGPAEAWSSNGALYLRTRLSILSPAFTNHVGSADGMHVYKFYSVIPNLLASANGKTTTLIVSGY